MVGRVSSKAEAGRKKKIRTWIINAWKGVEWTTAKIGTLVAFIGLLTGGFALAVSKTDMGRINHAIGELKSPNPSDTVGSWLAQLEVLSSVPDEADEYRAAAAGLTNVLRTKIRLDYSFAENITDPCEVSIQNIKLDRRAITAAVRALSSLSIAGDIPIVLDSTDWREVNVPNLKMHEFYARGSCLRGVDLSGLQAKVADFSYSNLQKTSLARAIVNYIRFDWSIANELSLEAVVADSARFFKSNIKSAVFSEASLPFTHFTSAQIDGAVLNHACLYGSSFAGATVGNLSLWDDAVYSYVYLGNLKGNMSVDFRTHVEAVGAVTAPLLDTDELALRKRARAQFAASKPAECRTTEEARAALGSES